MYAVIKTGGKQYKVSEGDFLRVEKIEGQAGAEILFEEVLLVSTGEATEVGKPFVKKAKVVGEIIAQTKGPKLTVFKMKKRKGFRKKRGHRQELTRVKIKEISV
jgi:large subunit ribosomal protein L21